MRKLIPIIILFAALIAVLWYALDDWADNTKVMPEPIVPSYTIEEPETEAVAPTITDWGEDPKMK